MRCLEEYLKQHNIDPYADRDDLPIIDSRPKYVSREEVDRRFKNLKYTRSDVWNKLGWEILMVFYIVVLGVLILG